jgi:hypothetical protein
MTLKTITATVDVDIDIDDFDDDELINELDSRGYTCLKSVDISDFDREDLQFLLELLDKIEETWYTRRVRDKLLRVRHV